MIRPHHQGAIARLAAHFCDDPRYPALLIDGSVAAGRASEGSDIDVIFVASDEEWERRRAAKDIILFSTEFTDYPGGYVDGKVVSLQFLRDLADFGSEPLRSALQHAFPAYSHLPELDDLLVRIGAYPEHEREEKMLAFYSQVYVLCDYITEEFERRNGYYVPAQTAANMVHFGGRLILAYNRLFYPGLKGFMTAVQEAPEKPEDFFERADAVLREPVEANALAFRDCIIHFRDWGITNPQLFNRFIMEHEWHWWAGHPSDYTC